jgi:hypothetical protein
VGRLAPPRAASADQQDELPAQVTVLDDAVRRRDLGQREGLRDREREASTISRTSGPPNWLKLTAFIVRSDLGPDVVLAERRAGWCRAA